MDNARMKLFLSSSKDFLIRSRKSILLGIVVVILSLMFGGVFSVLVSRYHNIGLPNIGNIKTIGLKAYENDQLIMRVENVTWGTVYPGEVINTTLYLHSVSNEIIRLHMVSENWTFSNSSGIVIGPAKNTTYMRLGWDLEGKSLEPNQHVRATFTLQVDSSSDFLEFLIKNQIRSFAFDVRIVPED